MIGTGHTFTLDAPFTGLHGAVLEGFLRVGFIHDEDANEIEITETTLQVGPIDFPTPEMSACFVPSAGQS